MIELRHDGTTTLAQVVAVGAGEPVSLSPATAELLDRRRGDVVRLIESTGRPAYGFNRGFGSNVDRPVPSEGLSDLQYRLLRSHACGVGPLVDRRIIRSTMFLRARSLAAGHSGVRSALVFQLVDLLNRDIVPCVPSLGSVGASGDLAPLSHIGLAVIGEGSVTIGTDPTVLLAAEALSQCGLVPLRLEMKEGLALNNGLQFSCALAIHCLDRMQVLLKTATLSTALAVQVFLGSDSPFLEELHELRPHPGARTIAGWLRNLLRDSPIRQSHEQYDVDGQVQDPYSLRCSAQILGACADLLEDTRRTLSIEVNSVTDNPLLLESQEQPGVFDRIVSGGHFHGMPLATRVFHMLEAMAIMARLSNMRCARYVDSGRNRGLGHDLKWPGLSPVDQATSSAMMIPEYVSAALTNEIWGACMPSHLFSLSTDAGQEDHVSMSAGVALRAWSMLPRLSELLAIELAYGAQAAAIRRLQPHFPTKVTVKEDADDVMRCRREAYEQAVSQLPIPQQFDLSVRTELLYHWKEEERRLSPPCEEAVRRIHSVFPPVTEDRVLSGNIQDLAAAVLRGDLVKDAEFWV